MDTPSNNLDVFYHVKCVIEVEPRRPVLSDREIILLQQVDSKLRAVGDRFSRFIRARLQESPIQAMAMLDEIMAAPKVGSGNQASPEHSVATVQERSEKDHTLNLPPSPGDGIAQAKELRHSVEACRIAIHSSLNHAMRDAWIDALIAAVRASERAEQEKKNLTPSQAVPSSDQETA